jgi:hypothetical protein
VYPMTWQQRSLVFNSWHEHGTGIADEGGLMGAGSTCGLLCLDHGLERCCGGRCEVLHLPPEPAHLSLLERSGVRTEHSNMSSEKVLANSCWITKRCAAKGAGCNQLLHVAVHVALDREENLSCSERDFMQ